MSVRIRFCPDCNNLLDHKENPRKKVLQYACRTCPYMESCDQSNIDDMCVYRRDVSFTYREQLKVRPDVIHDPTLSRTFDYQCKVCSNSEAVFWQLPESQQDDALALMFVCTGCGTARKEVMQTLDSPSNFEREGSWTVLPMSKPYSGSTVYVRKCYQEYYDLIMAILDDGEYRQITVCGTPGTGKSIFYTWFYERYRRAHPERIVVCGCYSENNQLLQSKVFGSDKPVQGSKDRLPGVNQALYLLDGPPDMLPYCEQTVIFASPNRAWQREVAKDSNHITIYMDIWQFHEVFEANQVLSLNIDPEELRQRFAYFGGIPRSVLAQSAQYDRAKARLLEVIESGTKRFSRSDTHFHQTFHCRPIFTTSPGDSLNIPDHYRTEISATVVRELIQRNLAGY